MDAALLKLLIVDDRRRTRTSLKALLTAKFQLQAREASDGLQAVREVLDFHPDIVLMDVRMPEMDGIAATRLIKARNPAIKVILVSMYPEYRVPAMNAGADAFISKGEAPQELLKTFASLSL